MITFKIVVSDAEEVRKQIIQAHSSSLSTADWNLIDALTHDYQKWFSEIMNAVDIPLRRKDIRWNEGEPRWVLVLDQHGSLIAYASLFVSRIKYFSFHPDKILDIFVREDEDILEIAPVLRKAIDDLFWLIQFQQERPLEEKPKSLKSKKNASP